jgi:hypothetical protein
VNLPSGTIARSVANLNDKIKKTIALEDPKCQRALTNQDDITL